MGNTIKTILQVLSNKALGGTITNNSDSIILADNNNYIQDFKGNKYGLPTVRYDNGGHLFGNGGDGRTTLPHVGDSWRNTETGESGTVVGYAPDVPYMGDDGKLYPTTSPVVKYDSGETLFGVTPQYTLPEVEVSGHLSTPADDLDTVIADMATAGIASTEKMASDQLKEGINNGNWRDIVNGAATAFSPLTIPAGPLRPFATTLFGVDRLFVDPNGIQKTGRELLNGNYWNAAKSFAGDVFNGAIAGVGAYGIADDALNLAARLGNANAKSIQFARALNKDIGNTALQTNPRSISTEFTIDPVSNNLDAEYTLYDAFGDKMGKGWMAGVDDGTRYVNGIKSTNIGKGVTEDIYNTAVTDTSNGLRSGVTTMYSPQKTLAVTRGKMGYVHEGFNEEGQPVTRITSPSQKPLPQRVDGSHYQEVAPKTTIRFNEATGDLEEVPIKQEEEYVPTSWRFYERGPARISEAERVGIPKGERGMLTDNEKQALEDLSQYRNSGQYRQRFMVDNQENPYWGGVNSEGVNFVQFATDQNFPFKYDNFRVNYSTDTGQGVLSYNPNRNMAGYSSRMFTAPSGLKWAPGEANMFINGDNESKIILTAPKTDAQGLFLGDKPASEVIPEEELSSTIDKAIMKDFWTKVRQVQRPGTYLSGDNGRAPKGSDLIQAFKKKQLHKADFKERPLKEQFVTRDGVSPDAFSSIVRQGLRDGSLRWGEGFAKWNNSAVQNREMYEAWQQYMKNQITAQEYENIYNKWVESLGANKPLQWMKIGNREYPIHPHPYIYQKNLGGSLNILKV